MFTEDLQCSCSFVDQNTLFSGGDKEVRFVTDEDDEERTTMSHSSMWQEVSTEEPSD